MYLKPKERIKTSKSSNIRVNKLREPAYFEISQTSL